MKSRLCIGSGALLVIGAALLAALPGCLLPLARSNEAGDSVDLFESDGTAAGADEVVAGGPESGGETGAGSDGASAAAGSTGDAVGGSESGATGGTTGAGTSPPDTDGFQSGTLTAGSFDDNLNLDVFRRFVSAALQSNEGHLLPVLTIGQRIIVSVKDQNGVPVGDARVVVTPQSQSARAIMGLTTGTDGRALFLTGLDDDSGAAAFTLAVHPPDGSAPLVEIRDPNSPEWNVTLPAGLGKLPGQLDLAFLIDSTGSMGDELEYLKVEVRSIAQAVRELFPNVQHRYALIVYRDEGDIYVVQPFAFTAALDDFVGSLAAQSADGGGDWPEAVHLALEEVGKLAWAASDTARVLFWIADAPPHAEFAQRTFDAIQALRAKNIAVFPVAASGVGTELEFYMRTAAFLTLSEYLFLTDDSGVGNPHAEPYIPCYQVQRLDQLMIRMIRAELSGTRIEVDPADIIRTVGNPVRGVCTAGEDGGQGGS